ncbi:hypothetical protein CO019_01820 [Candidatus Berkelbacteria bacterium CG_4_9_14_0_2_um_filter_42_30]|uniref:GxxExxY protein n=3 Tax=Candidatus Berkelbacteria TaxID=1618330 RepID=A0A2M7K180_9BACT|nr:MAG: hypothetical protein COV40_02905 [Candidatus Berkelbacteria bacterium CG11_big_fil_rev_8_21_14_0_20_42_15]PIX29974.1 MAG: hypothetical protein COZ63_02200 [Candidatus Berkelbacteria bacterium CG_4_8_14_3_um_filter_42_13]PJC65603.1 MAG: hypothetical protein CO019_01820 [Candidatus Berkelbacteria bacterium CG_4_9_14_0_2_um_filter_42_30]
MSTDETKKKYPEQELTKKIIGIAFQAQNEIGSGFAEKIYQKVFEKHLKESGLKYKNIRKSVTAN